MRRRRRSRHLAVIAVAGTLVSWAGPDARAFELPDLGILLGTSDPFAVFPDSLPPHGCFRARAEYRELYRFERGPTFRNFDVWMTEALGLARLGPLWLGARYGGAGADLFQRQVYDEADVFDGDRDVERWAVVAAARARGHEIRGLAGASREPEVGLAWTIRRPDRALRELGIRGWVLRSGTDVSQEVRGTKFFFPFEYRDEAARVGVEAATFRDVRLRLEGGVRRWAGQKTHAEVYNLLDIVRWDAEAAVRTRHGVDMRGRLEQATVGIEMALDGTVYAATDDFLARHFGGEVGYAIRPWLRGALGYDGWQMRSDDPGYVDLWPFTVWDVFTATRFRLESLDSDWDAIYGRLTATRAVAWSVFLEIDVRYEWWDSDGDLHWKERVPTLPPFFFRFDHYVDPLALDFTRGAQVDARLSWRPAPGAFVRLEAQAVAPFAPKGGGREGDDDGGEAGDIPKSERGGLRFAAEAGVDW